MGHEAGEPELQAIMRDFPDFWKDELIPFYLRAYEVSGLDAKTLELVLVAILALRGWETGMRVHAKQALDAGANADEIRGAIMAVIGVGGIHRVAVGLNAVVEVLDDAAGTGDAT